MEQNQLHKQTFIVNINNKKITCKKQLCKMSTFLNNLLYLGTNTMNFGFEDDQDEQNQEQQIHIQLINQLTFLRFVQFCQLNNYQQPIIPTPIKTNKLQDVLDEKNFKFINQFDFQSQQLLQLLKASQFLGCKSLQKVIASKFACLIYFKDSKADYQHKCIELKIQGKIDYKDDERFKKEYPSISK